MLKNWSALQLTWWTGPRVWRSLPMPLVLRPSTRWQHWAHSFAYLFFSCGHLSAEQSVTLDWTICIGRGFPGNKNWGRWGRYSLQVFYWPWNLHCAQKKLISMIGFSFSKQTKLHLLQFRDIIAACTILRTKWDKNKI